MVTLSDYVGTSLIFCDIKDLRTTIKGLQSLLRHNEQKPDFPAIQIRYHAGVGEQQVLNYLTALKRMFGPKAYPAVSETIHTTPTWKMKKARKPKRK